MNKPYLVNAVQYSELHPKFEVPPHSERFSLRPGDVAKVCIRFDPVSEYQGERFWVLIETASDGIYTGTVDNDLVYTNRHGLENGDPITFDYRHIYNLQRGPFNKPNAA